MTSKEQAEIFGTIEHGNIQKLIQFLNQGLDINAQIYGRSMLQHAALYERTDIVELLVMRGANVNYSDAKGSTLLMFATRFSNPEILKLLLTQRADVNAQNFQGTTALQIAAKLGNLKNDVPRLGLISLENAKLLLAYGADRNLRGGPENATAAEYARDEAMKKLFEDGIEFEICDDEKSNAIKRKDK